MLAAINPLILTVLVPRIEQAGSSSQTVAVILEGAVPGGGWFSDMSRCRD